MRRVCRTGPRLTLMSLIFFFQAEDGIRDYKVTGVQTCALPISTTAGCATATGGVLTPAGFVGRTPAGGGAPGGSPGSAGCGTVGVAGAAAAGAAALSGPPAAHTDAQDRNRHRPGRRMNRIRTFPICPAAPAATRR